MITVLILLVTFVVITLLVCFADALAVTLPFILIVIGLPLLDFLVFKLIFKRRKKK